MLKFHEQTKLKHFLKYTSCYLAILSGPVGCGKSYQLMNIAKKEFAIYIDASLSHKDPTLFMFLNDVDFEIASWDKDHERR
jgi:hypothetical protein